MCQIIRPGVSDGIGRRLTTVKITGVSNAHPPQVMVISSTSLSHAGSTPRTANPKSRCSENRAAIAPQAATEIVIKRSRRRRSSLVRRELINLPADILIGEIALSSFVRASHLLLLSLPRARELAPVLPLLRADVNLPRPRDPLLLVEQHLLPLRQPTRH